MAFTKEQKQIIRAIQDWADEHYVSLEDTTFYTKEDWIDRGESYFNEKEVVLNVTTEGELNHVLNMYDGYTLFDSFYELLEELGYWFEMGTHWYFAIYKL